MSNENIVSKNLSRILKITNSYSARIIAVTKYYDESKIKEAYEAGLRDFGESRALEAIEKINKLEDKIRSNSIYHFIGHLQTNKVKHVVSNFEYVHSVDSLKVAKEIDRCAKDKGIVQKVLIQVNNANEESKFGIVLSQLKDTIEEIQKLNSVKIEGLMNIAPLLEDKGELKKLFTQMKKLNDEYGFRELSMGMSNDYEIALDCGATMIRLGRILFKNL